MGKSKHEKESYLGYWVRAFLCTYLTNIRNLSGNTMRAYRDAIKQLISFVFYITCITLALQRACD